MGAIVEVLKVLILLMYVACSMWRYLGNDLKPEHRGGYNLEIEKEEVQFKHSLCVL